MKYYIKKEIFNQFEALRKTYHYFLRNNGKIKNFLKNNSYKSITFIGSGSSYSLCQSAALSVKMHLNINANSIAAGDLMLNFKDYKDIIYNTLLVTLSRSGNTSEVLLAVKKAKERYKTPCISICANEGSELAEMADVNLEIPWAFDNSVCQTRTVTNLYAANLLLIDTMSDEAIFMEDIKKIIDYGSNYIETNKDSLKNIGEDRHWDKVVVLADSELQGIADEASLAFKEISRLNSYYHHILDVRHGPMVLIDDKTLIIMATSNAGLKYQHELITDLKAKKAQVITVGKANKNELGSDLHIELPNMEYAVQGIPFIVVPQIIAFYKAVQKEINPDQPEGLDPWINLN